MSNIQNRSDRVSDELAFEYVSGTLRGEARNSFHAELQSDTVLQAKVRFWEEQLMASHDLQKEKAPRTATFNDIKARIQPQSRARRSSLLENLSIWRMSTLALAFSWLLTVGVFITQGLQWGASGDLNADYVAVLTDKQGGERLTALTSLDGKTLWLKWQHYKVSQSDNTLQLWARSRRDGQIRSLYVFDGAAETVTLSQAKLRLIKDAEDLILTEEGPGGSMTDEPSQRRLARGICVRLGAASKS